MRTDKQLFKSIAFTALLFIGTATAGIAQDTTTIMSPEADTPVILSTSPTGGEMNVDLNGTVKITFSGDMDRSSINGTTLVLHAAFADTMTEMPDEMWDYQIRDRMPMKESENNVYYTSGEVNGTISYSDKVAVFTPSSELKENTLYTFTVTNGVTNTENIALENDHNWSFTTTGTSGVTYSDNQSESSDEKKKEAGYSTADTLFMNNADMIDLGSAGQYVILAKESVVINSASRITGQIGEGSVADSFKNAAVDSNKAELKTISQNAELESNQSDTTSTDVNEAIEDMMTAFNTASMQNKNDSVSTAHMNVSFKDSALTSGTYEWSDSLTIDSDVTLAGSADDMWVFKVGDNLTVQENTTFTLTDGARAENIFWVVEGGVTIGENASFEGIILSMNEITLEKGAALNGRMYSQTLINLDDNVVSEPVNFAGQRTSTNR